MPFARCAAVQPGRPRPGPTGLLAGLLLAGLLVVALRLPSAASATLSADAPVAAASAAHRLDGSAPTSADRPGYAFSSLVDGRPVRWDPCQPVRWTVDLAGAPPGALAVLREAVGAVAAASGTRWAYVGASPVRPTSAVLPRSAQATYPPVLLGWTDGSSDLLHEQPKGVLAMTRTAWFGVRQADGSTAAAVRAAVVAFDRTERLPLRGPVSWQAVAVHELGHVLGLAHVSDPDQLMAAVLPRHVDALQDGDRAGLRALGRAAGCVVVP